MMEKNIKYMLDQLDKQKNERDKQLGLFNWIRSGVITFEEYLELVKYLVITDVVGRSELLNDVHKPCTKEEIGLGRCKEHCGKCEYIV